MRRHRALCRLPDLLCLLAAFGLRELPRSHAAPGGKPLESRQQTLESRRNREVEKDFVEASRLLRQGKLAEAEPAFDRVARQAKGTRTGERAQYFLAETQYRLRRFVKARDSFERLIADYPGTEFNPKLVSREYSLAMIWLSASGALTKPEQRLPWYSRLIGEQPLVGTQNAALELLQQVQQHDPTGPFAAKAAFQLVMFHVESGDEAAASRAYDWLVQNHPRDPEHLAVTRLRHFQIQTQRWRQEAAARKLDGEMSDGDEGEVTPALPAGTFDDWVFGGKMGFQKFRGQLDAMLNSRIYGVERTFRLTLKQRQKLKLAGHGDIARLLDRVNEARKASELARSDIGRLADIQQHLRSVDLMIVSGPFERGSFFEKTFRKMIREEILARAPAHGDK